MNVFGGISMAETYCGKSCGLCEDKLHHQCPGCRVGPGKRYSTECGIAKCCIGRDLQSCEDCKSGDVCILRRNKNLGRGSRVQLQVENEALLRQKYHDCALLGKWLMVMFWIMMVHIIFNIFISFIMSAEPIRALVSAAVLLIDAIIVLLMSPACGRFRIAGILAVIGSVLSLVELIEMEKTVALLVGVLSLVVSMVAEYQQFMGLIETTAILDRELADKWGNLWAAYFVCLCITLISLVLVFFGSIFSFIAALATAGGAFGMIVVSVLRAVYLYNSGTIFKRYANNIEELILNPKV